MLSKAYKHTRDLNKLLISAGKIAETQALATYYHDKVLTKMEALRKDVDALENVVSADYWPFPTYGDLLFGI